MVMNTVNIATLKGKLSHYLKLVQKGQEVVVTSHRHRVARILPISAPSPDLKRPSRPVEDLPGLQKIKRRPDASSLDSLIQDRRRR
jgi:prevent-host-death family protein